MNLIASFGATPTMLVEARTADHLSPYDSVLDYWWVWALILTTLLIAAVLLLTWDSSGPHGGQRPRRGVTGRARSDKVQSLRRTACGGSGPRARGHSADLRPDNSA